MKKRFRFSAAAFLLVSFLLVCAAMAQAVVTGRINFQGRLSDDSGIPVPDGDYQMTFFIYSSSTGGSPIWSETQNVATTDGIYSVVLGLINELDPYDITGDRYLGVKVESDSEMSPRQLLTAVPFALKAADSEALSGQSATDFASAVHGHSFAEITGTVTDVQVPDNITINNADMLDNKDSTDFANAAHGHVAGDITGTLNDTQIPATIARDSEVMPLVLDNDGPGTGLNADLLDGLSSGAFLSSSSDYGRSGVAPDLYEGSSTLTSKYVNVTGDSMTGGLEIDTGGTDVRGVDANAFGDGAIGIKSMASGDNANGIQVMTFANSIGQDQPRGVDVYAYGSSGYGGYFHAQGSGATGIYAFGTEYAAKFNGKVAIQDDGTTVMELGAGLDYAEGFDVSDMAKPTPGSVLIIDPENPGKLTVSTTAYDTKVAGIVAGANNLGSGVRLGGNQFDNDVALAGRVFCNVDATNAAIRTGDLLTTSDLPGYAMKAGDYACAQGAILGKAMQGLEKGEKGQILVLVTLQ